MTVGKQLILLALCTNKIVKHILQTERVNASSNCLKSRAGLYNPDHSYSTARNSFLAPYPSTRSSIELLMLGFGFYWDR